MSADGAAAAPPKAAGKTKPKGPPMAATAVPLFVRRYSGQPGPKIVGAAGEAESLLGQGEAELVIVAVPEGELPAARAALERAGVRWPE